MSFVPAETQSPALPGARPAPRLSARTARVLLLLLIPAALVGVFVLPLFFPPAAPSFSSAYVYGFSNRVAALAVVALACVRLLIAVFSPASNPSLPEDVPLPRVHLVLGAFLVLLFTTVLGGLTLRTEAFTSDAAYFLGQLTKASLFRLPLYSGLEFPYGPLLFYAPLWLKAALIPMRLDLEAVYLLTLTLFQVAGLALAFDLVQRMPGTRLSRAVTFWLLAAGSLQPALGLNYTLFRFLLAPWALVRVAAQPTLLRRALATLLLQGLTLATSPEVGFVFAGGLFCYAAARVWQQRSPREAWLPVVAGMSSAIFFALSSPDYLLGFRRFSAGMLNRVLSPSPELFVFLLIAIGLAPLLAAESLKLRSPQAAVRLGCLATALLFVPSALGLADNLHLFFSGTTLLVLALASLRRSPRLLLALGAAVALFVANAQLPGTVMRLRSLAAQRAERDRQLADAQRLEQLLPPGSLFAPAGLPFALQNQLLNSGRLRPDSYNGLDEAWDPAAERAKAAEAAQSPFLLLPTMQLAPPSPDNRRRMLLLRFGYRYPPRRAPYLPLETLRQHLLHESIPLPVSPALGNGLQLFRKMP